MKKSKVNKIRNHFFFVLDQSTSMQGISEAVRNCFNEWVGRIREDSKRLGQETTVSLITFSDCDKVKLKFLNWEVDTLLPLKSYPCDGMTALFDGVGLALEYMKDLDDQRLDMSHVLVVLTDGQENDSDKYAAWTDNPKFKYSPKKNLIPIMNKRVETDRYTLVFQLPPGHKQDFCNKFGIAPGNVREWANTEEGTQETSTATLAGISNYMVARSTGKKSIDTFYVDVDLHDLKKADLKNLKDYAGQFFLYEVPKEIPIKDFVEGKTKRVYQKGSTYYQLMKKEIVQLSKNVLLMEKGKSHIYGGYQARNLLGLPIDGNAKVNPLDVSKYDVFIQSTSTNRILPRGTRVLVEK